MHELSVSAYEAITLSSVNGLAEKTTNPEQAKFQFTVQPELPSKCSSCGCGSNGRKRFVDWNCSIDYHGAVVLCEDCALEVVSLFGYSHPKLVSRLEKRAAEIQEENLELKTQIEALKNVVAVFNLRSPDSSNSDSADEPTLFDEDFSKNESSAVDPTSIFAKPITRTRKPTSEPPSSGRF